MKLKKALNPNIYYSFGNKYDSLSLIKHGKRAILIDDVVVPHEWLIMAEQTHSSDIRIIQKEDLASGFHSTKPEVPHVDGFVTDRKNAFLVIKGADCTPILVYSKNKDLVGACHSGRNGTRNGIIKELLKTMLENYQVLLSDLVVMIGPAIRGKNYQVSKDIFDDFVAYTNIEQDYRRIDMQKVIIRDVLAMGLPLENLKCSNECTFENIQYKSYRRDKTRERQLSIIGILNGKIH